ncbi:MAG: four helix bundle protein [Cyanobacteria bacterium P01_G01_bin.67]
MVPEMQDFTKLKVWQKAHSFTINLYRITANFPVEERYGLTNQIRRASVSIESNISEGCGRNGNREFCRFLDIAQGSANEVKCQVYIARDLGYIDGNTSQLLTDKINEVSKMISSFNQKLITNN